jgi:hypothetical protein
VLSHLSTLENGVLVLVIVVSLAAHVYLAKWVKFKIDEGVIVKCLDDAALACADRHLTTVCIAIEVNLSVKRVALVCERSKLISALTQSSALSSDAWVLKQA